MLDVAASAQTRSSRSALGWGTGALSAGALLALIGMMAKPPELTLRWLSMLVAGSGVLLASAGALALVAGVNRAGQAAEMVVAGPSVRALLPGLGLALGSALALTILINRALAGVVPAPAVSLGIAVPALCLGMVWGIQRCAGQFRAAADPGARPVAVEV
jgi:hypothetical protein